MVTARPAKAQAPSSMPGHKQTLELFSDDVLKRSGCQLFRYSAAAGVAKNLRLHFQRIWSKNGIARTFYYRDSSTTPKATSEAPAQRRQLTFSLRKYFANRVSKR